MAGIQSNINSAIGSVGLLLNMSGALKKHGDMAQLKKQEGNINKQIDARREVASKEGFQADEAWHQQGVELAQAQEAVMKKKFDVDPSAANLENYTFAKGNTEKFSQKLSAFQAQQKAMQHMQNAQDEKRMRIYGARGEVINGQ